MLASPQFHFFTLVTRDDQYDAMRESLRCVGFDESNSRFTLFDNRERNIYEPYSAISEAVRISEAPYIVFCHQDLIFQNGPAELLSAITSLESLDPKWAVLGNTGHTPDYGLAISLDDLNGAHRYGDLPAKVLTLDENFLVIRRDSGLNCTSGLSGFHLYATDLCLNAYLNGWSAYVIDYRLLHRSTSLDYVGLHQLAHAFRKAWRNRVRGAVLLTPSMVLIFSRIPFLFGIANRVGMHRKLVTRHRLLRTLDRLLGPRRPNWLPRA